MSNRCKLFEHADQITEICNTIAVVTPPNLFISIVGWLLALTVM